MSAGNASKTTKKHRVLLVDDHPLVRRGVALLVSQESDMEVCGEADNVMDALKVLQKEGADLAVVDLTLKDSSGLELIRDISNQFPHVKILVLSMRDESFYAERALRAGARGYVTKEKGPEKVVEAIRRILSGQVYVSEEIAAKVMSKLVGGTPGATPMDGLTDRELEIFELIGQGLATREVAKKLHISTRTVDSHREHIKEKLSLGSAAELLKHAVQWVQYHNQS